MAKLHDDVRTREREKESEAYQRVKTTAYFHHSIFLCPFTSNQLAKWLRNDHKKRWLCWYGAFGWLFRPFQWQMAKAADERAAIFPRLLVTKPRHSCSESAAAAAAAASVTNALRCTQITVRRPNTADRSSCVTIMSYEFPCLARKLPRMLPGGGGGFGPAHIELERGLLLREDVILPGGPGCRTPPPASSAATGTGNRNLNS